MFEPWGAPTVHWTTPVAREMRWIMKTVNYIPKEYILLASTNNKPRGTSLTDAAKDYLAQLTAEVPVP